MPTASPHAEYLAAIQAVYSCLENGFDTIYQATETVEERQTLRNLHAAARDAYWRTRLKQVLDELRAREASGRAAATQLADNNPIVRDIYDDLVRANQELRDLLANLQRAAALLRLMTQAVRLAGALVTLATVA